MQYRAGIVAAISALTVVEAAALASPYFSVRSQLPEGYRVEHMTWTGVVERGGPEVSINGTIEEVTRQIRAVKKDFTWAGLRRDLGLVDTPLQERGIEADIKCGIGGEGTDTGPGAPKRQAEEARDMLEEVPGACEVAAGPRACSVVSCAGDAAIWLCNDNAALIAPACSSLASHASDIIGKCARNVEGIDFSRGQKFQPDNTNVIVGLKLNC
ncbi:hypothetical protein F4802DRAFT_24835 [Xylaria palmicola]|nr:hypothetical protein F4802DRAFT_24835 [Xylaria palmicola]